MNCVNLQQQTKVKDDLTGSDNNYSHLNKQEYPLLLSDYFFHYLFIYTFL